MYTPPEEYEELSCKRSFKIAAFSLQTGGSGRQVLTKAKRPTSLFLLFGVLLSVWVES